MIPHSKTRPGIRDGGISLDLVTNLFLGSEPVAEKVLHTLIDAGGVFIPESFDDFRKQVSFDPSDLTVPMEGWTKGWVPGDERYSLGIHARRLNPLKVLFHVATTEFVMFDMLSIFFCLDRNGVIDPKLVELFDENVGLGKVIDVAKSLYDVIGGSWGTIRNDFHEHSLGTQLDDEGNVTGWTPPKARWALRGLFWANFFGPEYVEMWGKEKLLSAPCYKAEELRDGGAMIVLSESPFDASRPEYNELKQKLYDYLGEDAFTGKILPTFKVGEGRKRRDARPLVETGGIRDDIFH